MSKKSIEFDYINTMYNLNLTRGKRVKCTEANSRFSNKYGTVAKGEGNYIHILFDGDLKTSGPFHPTSGLEYLDSLYGEEKNL